MLEIIFCLLAREAGVGRAKRELGLRDAAGWGGVGGSWGKKGGGAGEGEWQRLLIKECLVNH